MVLSDLAYEPKKVIKSGFTYLLKEAKASKNNKLGIYYMIFRRFLQISVFLSVLGTSGYALAQDAPLAPEPTTGIQQKQEVSASDFMAVTAHPDATKAAYDILKQGGTAADAAIAAQMVLGLVEPQSSGVGGGAFLLYYDNKHKQLFTLDGRETAPSTAGEHLFTGADGKPMGFYEAALGGRSVGTPGVLKLLSKLYDWQGKTDWVTLFQPAIQLAEKGFTVSERLNKMLAEEQPRFEKDVKAKIFFFPDTVNPIEAGSVKRNPEYAISLRQIAQEGPTVFYGGKLGKDIVEHVKKFKGSLSIEDLTAYQAKERKAVCDGYRGYKVCSMGEPSSGGLTLLMILGMLENFDLPSWGPNNPTSWHVINEASRLAFADRNKYMADADKVETPNELLLNSDYLNQRSKLIDINKPMLSVSAGLPPAWIDVEQGSDPRTKNSGTSHISIVDSYGNILSMTTSVETAFGSHLMVGGFVLNNQLTDFSFKPTDENGQLVANRVGPGKRPRSSMAPVIVFDPKGRPFMVIGSAGGSRIIGYVLQRIISVIDWKMGLQDAIDAPNILNRGNKLELESSGMNWAETFKNLGHPVLVGDMNSGLTAIQFKKGKLIGAADPRRDGIAMGQ